MSDPLRSDSVFFSYLHCTHLFLHSFPTRRSSDLQPVTTNLLKFMRASIKMIGVSNLQSFIASMTQKLTLSDKTLRSEERFSRNAETDLVCRLLLEKKKQKKKKQSQLTTRECKIRT